MARLYADLIKDYGYEQAGRRLGIRINVEQAPTHEELVDVIERSGLSFLAIDLGEEDRTFGQTEAGEEVAPGVARVALGEVNAYLVGEVDGPWILVDAGTPRNAERICAAARERFLPRARPEAIVLTHGRADHSGTAAELSDLWDVPSFRVPEHGRYASEPVRFNEGGVAWLPSAPPDPLPKAAAVLGMALLVAGTGAVAWLAKARRHGQSA